MKQITQKCHRHEISAKHKPRTLRSIVSWRELALKLELREGQEYEHKAATTLQRPFTDFKTATSPPRSRRPNAARAERRDGGYPSSRWGALKPARLTPSGRTL
ncbi:MAG: hypothetical protein ACREYF_20270 [Gammaproteobacteria bacterium]